MVADVEDIEGKLELGHFEIVNLDRGFTKRRDHQVRLDGSFQLYVPRGDSVHGTGRQIYSFKVSADQSRPVEVRPAERADCHPSC